MSKEDFLGLIQSEAFKGVIIATFGSEAFKIAVREAVAPQFTELREEMRQFRDEVLTREDKTVGELQAMRHELKAFGNRLNRVEQYVGLR